MSDSAEWAAEVRGAVLSLPTVSEVSSSHDEQVCGVVVSAGSVTGPQVRAVVRAAGLRAPDWVVVVPSGLRWDPGAPDAREQLAKLRDNASALVYDFAAPDGPLEQALCAIWCDVLRVAEVGVQDDLLDLGGDSLTGIEIATRVEDRFAVECDLDVVFRAGTVRALAAELRQAGVGQEVPAGVPVVADGPSGQAAGGVHRSAGRVGGQA